MSGLVKGVKKVFKKVGKFVKKNWKPILAAVAIYFTAGVALSYFGSTAAFSASMPGFGAGGIFAKTAVWMGFSGGAGSGIAATAAAKAAGAAVGSVAAGTATQTVAGGAGPAMAGSGSVAAAQQASVLAPVTATATKVAGPTFTAAQYAAAGGKTASAAGAVLAGAGGATTATDALLAALNTQTKLSMVKMGIDTVSGLLAPDPWEEQRKLMQEKHELENASSFGVGRDGDATFGWGGSDTAAQWTDMNKRNPMNLGGGQSQFRDSQFVQTAHEQSGPAQMPAGGGGAQFIPTGQQGAA